MKIRFKFGLALAATVAVSVGAAKADIFVGLQETGVNGGGITTVDSTPLNSLAFSGTYGSFDVNLITALGTTSPGFLHTGSQNQNDGTGGTINIFITETNVSFPVGPTQNFLSSFTTNLLPSGWEVDEATFVDAANGLFGGSALSTASFNVPPGPDILVQQAPGNTGNGLYSITEEYTIAATSGCSKSDCSPNSTIDVSAVPGPIVGAGVPGLIAACGGLLAFARRRRKALNVI